MLLLLISKVKMPIDSDDFIIISNDFYIFMQTKEELIENLQKQYKNYAR